MSFGLTREERRQKEMLADLKGSWGICHWLRNHPVDFFEMDKEERALLLEFVDTFYKPKETINTGHSSYGYKHHFEKWTELAKGKRIYCSNGAMKGALILKGFKYKHSGGRQVNTLFNISESSITKMNKHLDSVEKD